MHREIYITDWKRLLTPFGGLADINDSPYHDIDPSHETLVRKIIREEILPVYHQAEELMKTKIKVSLSLFLSTTSNPVEYARPLDELLASELLPPEPKHFYIWLWQELFSSEPYTIAHLERYTISRKGVILYEKQPLQA